MNQMNNKNTIPTLALAFCCATATTLAAAKDFNFGWRFAVGEHSGAADYRFDDSSWEMVDLPHDWAISGDFGAPEEDGSTGKLPWQGEGWYRKSFNLADTDHDKRVILIFDGVMASPTVYLNGKKIGSWIYGYNSFWIDATDAARFGENNILAVHADTRQHHSRWYPGAGIYRKVTMLLKEPVHIPVWGVYATTPEVNRENATLNLKISIANMLAETKQYRIETHIQAPDGKTVGSVNRSVKLTAISTNEFQLNMTVANPQLWDVEAPSLYDIQVALVEESSGQISDRHTIQTGFRNFKWTVNDGFHLNGRRVQLYGVNLHHDHGPLGAAFFPRAMERQLQIMKEMGVNAIRTSHNAAAPELLELCDRMGLLVFNELFDKYGPTAGVECETAEYVEVYAEREIRNFVLRDRNHPSVVIWSIGNEIPDILHNKDGRSAEHVARMVSFFKKYDDTRPTTMGNHIPGGARKELGIFNALDTSGWNYGEKYVVARQNYPDKPLIYSESGSVFGTRGAYKLTLPEGKTDWGDDGYLNAYCLTAARWSDIPEHEFERMIKHSYVAGEFVWTGFDYLGEPTPFSRDYKDRKGRMARSSYFGIVDLAGLPKDSFFLYRSHWNTQSNTVCLTPHWNWQGHENQPIPVMLYTNGDEAELFLNGESLGRRKKATRNARRVDNLAYGCAVTASSEEHKQDKDGNVIEENFANKACDGSLSTRWCAADGSTPQFWEVNFEKPTEFSFVRVQWEQPAWIYDTKLEVSTDGTQWGEVQTERTDNRQISEYLFTKQSARKFRLTITKIKKKQIYASISEIEILKAAGAMRNPYFDVVGIYRIIWPDVPYVPGVLKAVAYKNGEVIGSKIVRTVGEATKLRISADRDTLRADGMDLCYLTIDMADQRGDTCPLAMNNLTFEVSGAATLAGVANGDQMGFDRFTDNTHPLFYGKAVAVLRSAPGKSGRAVLNVRADNGMKAQYIVNFE